MPGKTSQKTFGGARQSAPSLPQLLVIGAHPDDAEFHCGALMLNYAAANFSIHVISATDGSAGHQQLDRVELAERRKLEAAASAAKLSARYEVWSFPDGELQPDLALRHRIIEAIRRVQPDLLITHRSVDYHPDHRAVAQAVQDACYLVRVPAVLPDCPALKRDPVVACMGDLFTRPAPLRADIVIDCSSQLDAIVDLLACHTSQVFEWLPYTLGLIDQVPEGPADRVQWLKTFYSERPKTIAHTFSSDLVYAEVYEISEYGRRPSDSELSELFCLPIDGTGL